LSRHHTASPAKYPDRSEARPARTWSGTTPGKHTIRHGVTVHPRGLGKPTHRVSKRRDFWNRKSGVMSGPPNGPDSTPSEERKPGQREKTLSQPQTTPAFPLRDPVAMLPSECAGIPPLWLRLLPARRCRHACRQERRAPLSRHPPLLPAITAYAGLRHRLSASHRNGGTLQPAETEATRAAHNVGPTATGFLR